MLTYHKTIKDNEQLATPSREKLSVAKLRYATRSAQEPETIPENIRRDLTRRISNYAGEHFSGQFTHIDVYFRGALCYIDAYSDPAVRSEDLPPKDTPEYRAVLKSHDDKVTHLCRLRYLGSTDKWGFDFFAYSSEKYEPSIFPSGLPVGKPEDAFDLAATMYL